jgi:4-hydroxybenzoate polyprenyltransferase
MLIALAIAVATWVGGFDILYALQDVSFDRENGLHSVPATFGEANALGIARVLHLTTVAALALAGVGAGAGILYFAGVLVAGLLLLYEHSLVRADDFSRLDGAFFTMNGVISIVFLGFVFTERLLR